jgi:hypothetical protein
LNAYYVKNTCTQNDFVSTELTRGKYVNNGTKGLKDKPLGETEEGSYCLGRSGKG